MTNNNGTADELDERIRAVLAEHPPTTSEPRDLLGARFDAGLAWLHFPRVAVGLGLSQNYQTRVDRSCAAGIRTARPRAMVF
jgi:hypothetical protein